MRRLAALAVPLAILAALWVWADGPGVLHRLAAADPWWLLAGLAALLGQTVLSGLRWRRVARALGQDIAAGRAVREYFVAALGNQMLPGGVAGDAARAWRARGLAGLGPAAGAVAAERLAGQVALAAVLAAGMAASLAAGAIRWPPVLPWAVLAVLAALATALALAARGGHAAGRAIRALRGAAGPLAGLSTAIVALNLAGFACAARATGTALGPEAVVTVVPLVLTAMLVPASVAGWGWREGAAAALFPLAGATAQAGVAAGVAFGLVMLAAALPGAFWLVRPPHTTE
jgi:uncharacterized membrane protein YbhN (UPF0104 family)